MSKIEVNAVEPQCGTTLTLGASGDTVTLGSGASQSGFGRTGTVDWDTTKKTADFTATNGAGFFVDSSSSAITVTLPASPSAGNIVSVSDYNGSAVTNSITIARNGSNINGDASNLEISKADSAVTLVYVDATVGWTSVQTSNTSDVENSFIVATGGTITTSGDFKIHSFTGPGTFTVTNGGTPLGSTTVDYLVIAGGGGGGTRYGGGGGAGGYRESSGTASGSYSISPLGACVSALPVTAQAYPITVGASGAGSPTQSSGGQSCNGSNGSNSVFSTITSAGGGGGASESASGPPANPGSRSGNPGGSGGGGSYSVSGVGTGGAGNTPPVSPPQGNNAGNGGPSSGYGAGGGGGATAAGQNAADSVTGSGGNGATSSINGTPTTRAGGGGGAGTQDGIPTGASGGSGGGGAGGSSPNGLAGAGTTNTGSGGGGGRGNPDTSPQTTPNGGGAGGSGVVIIRYKFQ